MNYIFKSFFRRSNYRYMPQPFESHYYTSPLLIQIKYIKSKPPITGNRCFMGPGNPKGESRHPKRQIQTAKIV